MFFGIETNQTQNRVCKLKQTRDSFIYNYKMKNELLLKIWNKTVNTVRRVEKEAK